MGSVRLIVLAVALLCSVAGGAYAQNPPNKWEQESPQSSSWVLRAGSAAKQRLTLSQNQELWRETKTSGWQVSCKELFGLQTFVTLPEGYLNKLTDDEAALSYAAYVRDRGFEHCREEARAGRAPGYSELCGYEVTIQTGSQQIYTVSKLYTGFFWGWGCAREPRAGFFENSAAVVVASIREQAAALARQQAEARVQEAAQARAAAEWRRQEALREAQLRQQMEQQAREEKRRQEALERQRILEAILWIAGGGAALFGLIYLVRKNSQGGTGVPMNNLTIVGLAVTAIAGGAAIIAHHQLTTANLWTTPFSTLGTLSDLRLAGIAGALVGIGLLIGGLAQKR